MGQTDRAVFNLTHELVLGWPENFSMRGAPSEPLRAAKFYTNVPADFLQVVFAEPLSMNEMFRRMKDVGVPFGLTADIEPPQMITLDGVALRLRYTGALLAGMKAGERFRLVLMFIS